MHIHGIHHIAIKYEGENMLQKAIGFYNGLLKLPVLRLWGEKEASVALLDTGSGFLELFANSQGLPHGMINHIAFQVDCVDEIIDTVRAAGYEIILEPQDKTFPSTPPYSVRIGFCIGPGGEKVEFFKELV